MYGKFLMLMKRLYVLIDKSLNPVYGCVQGGHAVAQYLLDFGSNDWKNDYLIYLYADIDKWNDKLNFIGKEHTVFREPDLQNKMTAIACCDDGKLFKHLALVQ